MAAHATRTHSNSNPSRSWKRGERWRLTVGAGLTIQNTTGRTSPVIASTPVMQPSLAPTVARSAAPAAGRATPTTSRTQQTPTPHTYTGRRTDDDHLPRVSH